MTAQRLFLLTAGFGLLSATQALADDGTRLSSLQFVDSARSMFLTLSPDGRAMTPGVPAPTSLQPVTTTAPQPAVLALETKPQAGGTNLWGLVREPRASTTTPAGVRMVEPLALRVRADKR